MDTCFGKHWYAKEELAKKKKHPNLNAQALTAMRNKKLTPARRREIARKAAKARWKKDA